MQQLSNRKSPRANRYDYTSAGAYFITICTQNREESFGKIVDGKMVLNEIGRICDEELHIMLQKRPSVDLHEYVIMPNHVHLLLCVNDCRDDGLPRPNGEAVICSNVNCLSITTWCLDRASPVPTGNITNPTLWTIIGGRKSAVSKKCHESWYQFTRQSRYHDHIIRNEKEYNHIKRYIQNNPEKWAEDKMYNTIN